MTTFRCAALSEQSLVGRELGLKYADKLVGSFAALTDALNRHRGKGQQVVRVEHVTVQAGGQAIVGAVTQGGGGHQESEDRAHAQRAGSRKYAAIRNPRAEPSSIPTPDQPWPMHLSLRCGARTRRGSPCRSPAVKGRERCRMHGGATGSGARPANRNASSTAATAVS